MKVTDLIVKKLVTVGVERPSARLVDEIEKLITSRVESLVASIVTPRLAARAFAATLAAQGFSGDARERERSPEQAAFLGRDPKSVACLDPTTTTPQ